MRVNTQARSLSSMYHCTQACDTTYRI
jgi:hypothetical protein